MGESSSMLGLAVKKFAGTRLSGHPQAPGYLPGFVVILPAAKFAGNQRLGDGPAPHNLNIRTNGSLRSADMNTGSSRFRAILGQTKVAELLNRKESWCNVS